MCGEDAKEGRGVEKALEDAVQKAGVAGVVETRAYTIALRPIEVKSTGIERGLLWILG